MENRYKLKYEKLKAQYINAIDVAFRLGYEQGNKDAQIEQFQQMQQQQAEASAAQPQESAIQEEEPANIPADGSDIDSHIEQLEQLLGKSEFNKDDLQKAIDGMKLSKQMANINHNLHKNKQSAKKSLSIPQNVLSKINDNTKKTLTLQEKIVSDIMKSWDNEEKRASKDITNVLKIEGLIKKE